MALSVRGNAVSGYQSPHFGRMRWAGTAGTLVYREDSVPRRSIRGHCLSNPRRSKGPASVHLPVSGTGKRRESSRAGAGPVLSLPEDEEANASQAGGPPHFQNRCDPIAARSGSRPSPPSQNLRDLRSSRLPHSAWATPHVQARQARVVCVSTARAGRLAPESSSGSRGSETDWRRAVHFWGNSILFEAVGERDEHALYGQLWYLSLPNLIHPSSISYIHPSATKSTTARRCGR
jgi:hypothetical protein